MTARIRVGRNQRSDPLTGQLAGLGAYSAQINAHGQIVVDGYSLLGESWPILLTPVAPRP